MAYLYRQRGRRPKWLVKQTLLVALSSFAETGHAWWDAAFDVYDHQQLGSVRPESRYYLTSYQTPVQQDNDIWSPYSGGAILWSYPDPIEIVHRTQKPSTTLVTPQRPWTHPPPVVTRYGPPPPPRTTPAPTTTTPSPDRGSEVEDSTVVPSRYKPKKDEPLQLRTIPALSTIYPAANDGKLKPDTTGSLGWQPPPIKWQTGYVPAVKRERVDEWTADSAREKLSNERTGWPQVSKGNTWIKYNH